MQGGWRGWTVGAVAMLLSQGCDGTENGEPPATGGGAGGAPDRAGSASRAGAGSQAGMTTGGMGAAAGGVSHVLDCTGAFGPPELALPGEAGVALGSPTLSPDGLELIYARKPADTFEFRRATRSSTQVAFAPGSSLPSLDAACQAGEDRSADLSRDGLRAYVACYSSTTVPTGPATLRVAERAAVGQEFTILPGTSLVGPSPGISADELTLYSSSDVDPGLAPSRQYTRSATSEAFGSAMDIPGLEMNELTAPEPSPDGLSLFAGLAGNLVVSTRPSPGMPFGAPTTLVTADVTVTQLGAPELAQDCRSLYYIEQTYDVATRLVTSKMLALRR